MKKFIYLVCFLFCVNSIIAQNITGQSEVNSIACNGGVATWAFTLDVTTDFSYQVQAFSSGSWGNFGSTVTVPAPTNTFIVNNLFAGQFRVVLFDSFSVPSDTSDHFMVYQPAPLFNSFTDLDPVSCFGGNDGVATVTPNGGTAPYIFLWSDGSTSNPATGLSAGVYTCTITDANGCPSITVSTTITQPSSPLTASTPIQTNVSCFGVNDGTATVNPSGGTAPYTYLWPDGQTSQTATGLSPGAYTCTITDFNGCIFTTSSVSVTQPSQLITTTINTNVNCYGGNDGTATVNASGATSPYNYLWSDGQSTQIATGLSAGIYTCIITDANGCTENEMVTITQPSSALTASTPIQTNVTCFGGSDGTATANPSGGTSPYTYLWSDGQTTQMATGLLAGNYSCTIVDVNGCLFTTTSVAITQPLALSVNSISTPVSCFGGTDGSVTLTISGGVPPYSINFLTFSLTLPNILSTPMVIPAGVYSYNVTDNQGCVLSENVIVSEPLAPLVGPTTQTDVSCLGGGDGTATANPSGGTAPYTYLWSDGQNSQTATGLSPGAYTCTITDFNGCVFTTSSVDITQPLELSATTNKTNVSCYGGNDGIITANPSGGTAPYAYLWSDGQITQTATGLSAGIYTCIIIDANGCVKNKTVNITQPSSALTVPVPTQTSISCFGGSDGTVTANPSGGTSPYTYLWSDGQTTQIAIGLSLSTYTCVITDANGCVETAFVTLTQPQPLQVQINATEVSCNNGSDAIATALPSGGNAPYNYIWSNGTTTSTVTGLSATNYSVTVVDDNNCPAVIATVLINEPLAITAVITNVDSVSCFGGDDGEILLNVNGGNSPYTYLWSNTQTSQIATGLVAGNYTVAIYDATCNIPTFISTVVYEPSVLSATATVIDATCFGESSGSITITPLGGTPAYNYSWSNGQNSQVLTNQAFGIYDCSITDYSGCTTSVQATIDQPQELILSSTPTISASCFGYDDGSASVIPQGGTAPYNYFWSNGQTLQTAVDLVAGSYSIMVSDANNCLASDTLDIDQPVQINANLTSTDVLCNGDTSGNIILNNVSGALGSVSYLWSNGNTTFFNQNLGAGTYYVTVTDTNGCFNTFNSNVLEPSAISAGLSASDISINGANDGNISANISGGTSPYSYYWSGPNSFSSSNASISGLESGIYTLTVTDAYGCSEQFNQIINEPDCDIFISQTYTAPLCYGSTASIYWQNNGGLAPYSNTLTNSSGIVLINGAQYQSPNVAVQLPAGVYNLVVTDAAGCLGLWNIDVIEPDSLIADLALTDALCNGSNDGSATVAISGGSAPYNIDWGGSNPNLLTAGSYNMEVSDANGCSSGLINYIIGNPSQLVIDSISTTEISCIPGSDGTATIYGSGGVLPYSYGWSNGQTAQVAQSLMNGNYIAYLYDANNCQVSNNVQIINAPQLNVIIQPTQISCIGLNDGALSSTVITGSEPITYNWFNLANPATVISSDSFISNLYSGTYSLLATDVNGCINQATYSLANPNTITFGLAANNITSNGANDGWINTISVSGGQSPYSYFWTGPNGFTDISQNLVSLVAGTYTLTITDANGCQFSQSAVVNEPGCDVSIILNTVQPLCHGDNGSITWSNSGGVTSYQNVITDLSIPLSLYSGFGSTGAFSLAEGSYALEVTDQYGCSDVVNITITEPAPVLSSYTTSDVSCFGGSDGEIIVNPTGGTGIYTINYGVPNPSQLSAGIYSFTLSDDNGCQSVPFSNSYVIDEPTDITVTTFSTPVSCFNGNDGTATATAIGGTLPYSYFWQGSGATTSSLNNLTEGIYYVNVTDSNGCYSTLSLFSQVAVSQPSTSLAGLIIPTHVVCYGEDNGIASANPSGGTAPYSYLWSDGQTNQTVFGLSAGIYTCTITDANGCVTTLNVTINEPDEILAGLNTIPASCYGFSDGSASVNPTGGTGIYNIMWSANPSTNYSISNLSPGFYSVIVTDSDGCTTTSSPVIFSVLQADSLIVTASELNGTSCFNGNDGAATVIVSGGTPNYNYTWLDSLGNVISINSTVNGLSEASYSVIVNDLNGCIDTAEVLISSASQLLANISTYPASCFGGSDGSATAYPSGGTPPYTYQWAGGQGISTNPDYTSLNAATTYYFSIVDANGCNIYQEPVNISEPLPTSINFTMSDYNGFNVSCFGSSDAIITVHATGGTSPYQFSEQNVFYTTDSTFMNTSAGWFYAYVEDANGCVSLDSIEVTSPTILDPNIVVLQSLTCIGGNDGELASATQGGVGPYTYFWDNFSLYSSISGLIEDSYTVDVTDANGCVASETFVLIPDFEITATTFTTLVSCIGASDGTAIIQASGGTSPYSYLWNDGSINFSMNDTIIGLSPGPYACAITDANGCMGYDTINIIESTTSLVIDSSLTNSVSCFGGGDGSAIVYASGGIGNYIYQWDDSNSQITQQAVGLVAGTFIVTVTDSALCTVADTVIISEPLALDVNVINNTDISCFGFADGSLTSSFTGGTAPYMFSWNGPNLYTSNVSSIDNLVAGFYMLTITDDNGCEDTVSSWINEPIPLSILLDVTNPLCYNDINGIIDIQINGGIQPYDATYISGVNTYPANNAIVITGLGAGADTLYVFDANGCQQTSFINIIEPLELQIDNITQINPTCYNYTDGSVSIVATGGVFPYTYQLIDNYSSNIGLTSITNGLGDGVYTYIVNDDNGCRDSIEANIISPAEIEIIQLPSCYGSILVEVSNFIENYQIYWDNALDTVYIDGLSSGIYNATIIDSLGCTKTDSFIVNDPFSFTIYDAACLTSTDGSIALENISGGFPPYLLTINNELVSDDILDEILLDDLSANDYQLLLTDNGGCTIFDSLLVIDYIGGSNCVNTPIIISPNSDGINDTWKPADNINEEISVTIYNRWGQIEFFAKENSQTLEWDGRTNEGDFLPTADYYFVIHFINQYTMPDKTGVITLIR